MRGSQTELLGEDRQRLDASLWVSVFSLPPLPGQEGCPCGGCVQQSPGQGEYNYRCHGPLPCQQVGMGLHGHRLILAARHFLGEGLLLWWASLTVGWYTHLHLTPDPPEASLGPRQTLKPITGSMKFLGRLPVATLS